MVVIGAVAQMYDPRSRAKMSVVEKPQAFESVDRAIDGRLVDGETAVAGDGIPDLGGGEMVVVRAGENLADSPPGRGEPQTLRFERLS